MSEQKITIEDILREYSSGGSKNNETKESENNTDSPVSDTEENKTEEQSPPIIISNSRKELFDETLRRPNPANEFKPSDIRKVSVVNTDTVNDIWSDAGKKRRRKYVLDAPCEQTGESKIRRMADSTRAKELAGQKKRGKIKNSAGSTYSKEKPSGEYIDEPVEFSLKKRNRKSLSTGFEENITDIAPSVKSVKGFGGFDDFPDIHNQKEAEPDSIDIALNDAPEKAETRRKRHIVDFSHYGDIKDVGRDISALKKIISSRVVTLIITLIFSMYLTLCGNFSFPLPEFMNNVYIFLILHSGLGLISVIASSPVIYKGVKNLFLMSPDSDSMAAVVSLSCLFSIIPAYMRPDMLEDNTIQIYMTVGILSLLVNAYGKKMIVERASRNFRFVSKSLDRYGIVFVKNEERAERLTRGTVGDFPVLAAMRKTDFITDFLRYSYSADISDSYCKKAVYPCFLGSAAAALFITVLRMGTLSTPESAAFGFSIYSMLISACSCVALPLAVNIPLEKVSEKTIRNRGVMLGYQSVDDLYDANSVLVSGDMLFPEGTASVAGVKIFSNTRTDEALLEAASLAYHAGSIMIQLFEDVIRDNHGLLYTVENFSNEENKGFCGWIHNKRVLLGNRELMMSHNIEGIPTKSKEAEYVSSEQEILYLSISGNLAAMFIIELKADKNVKKWAKRLCQNKVCIIIKSVDPCLTSGKLGRLFDIPNDMLRIIPHKLFEDYEEETEKTVRMSASMACTGKFSSLAQLLIGTKNVHSSAVTGLILQTVSIILGAGLSLVLIGTKSFEYSYIYMSASAMVIYQLVFTAVTYMAVKARKL